MVQGLEEDARDPLWDEDGRLQHGEGDHCGGGEQDKG